MMESAIDIWTLDHFFLQIHGLKRHKLDMGQILPSIGFRHSDGIALISLFKTSFHNLKSMGNLMVWVLWAPFQESQIWSLFGPWSNNLRHHAVYISTTVLLSTQEYKWVTEKCNGSLMKLWEEINCNWLLAHSGGVTVLMLGLHVDKTQVKKLSLRLDCSVGKKFRIHRN